LLLTPAGIRHRVRLTQGYLARKEAEYEALKAEIAAWPPERGQARIMLHDVQRNAVEVDAGTLGHGAGWRNAFSSLLAPSTHYARLRWTENRAPFIARNFPPA